MIQIEHIKTEDLKPNPENINVHPEKSIEKIKRSIEEFGFLNPVVIDKDNVVQAGNGRLEAAKRFGMDEIPCIRAEHLTPEQMKAFAIADNRVAEDSYLDEESLSNLLKELEGGNFDIESLGFDFEEIIDILQDGDIFDKEKEDKAKEERIAGMDAYPFEHYDYIVFVFNNSLDFIGAVEKLGIKKINCSLSKKTKKIGLGRVLGGEKLLALLKNA